MGFILILLVIILGTALLLAVLFINTLSKTIKAISVSNRTISPEQVWLLLIPLFHFYWIFIVIARIAQSIRNEYTSRGLGVEAAPTYNAGLIFATLFVTNGFITLIFDISRFSIFNRHNSIVSLLSTAGTIAWILYWLKINSYKTHLKKLPPINFPGKPF